METKFDQSLTSKIDKLGHALPLGLSAILAAIVFWIASDFPFFWDTIQLAARQATHFYEGGNWLLPDTIDSGHPPGFGAYLSWWWQLLGRKLWVSHLAMFPWHWLLFYQLIRLCQDH
ncbi:MAG: hypothetical protein AAFQ37_10395, partial [Bacteroidota bacterium]